MRTFWKLIGYSVLALVIVGVLYFNYVVEAGLKGWEIQFPFFQYVFHTALWVVGIWFAWKMLSELGKLWDKRQATLDALLIASQDTANHLRLLRDELVERDNQQRSLRW